MTTTTEVTVQEGGRIELILPNTPAGERVRVSITTVQPVEKKKFSTLSEILDRSARHSHFKDAAEVDAYIRELRDDWDDED